MVSVDVRVFLELWENVHGIVRKVWPKVRPDQHADEVLAVVDELHL
jgi:hypothetical protein